MRSLRLCCLVAGFFLTLSGCGGNSSPSPGTGKLSIGITDAPIDSAEAVVIHVTSATLHGPGGDTTIDVIDPTSKTPGRDIDLLLFQGGQWTGLFEDTITAGHYSWIRLGLDLSKSYIQINGAQYGMSCTSCDNVGYRINRSFDVAEDATLTFMLDFDLRKSITATSGGQADYILRPTVRLIDSAASGSISGTVDSTLLASLGGGMCSVYVFDGQDATLDDIYIPVSPETQIMQNNPITTATVASDGSYGYTASFLPAGDYTIAVTCDAASDSAAKNDTLTFSAAQNVTVVAGETAMSDFAAPPVVTP